MDKLERVIEGLEKLREYADNEVHPVVSPDNWSVYSGLIDLIDEIEEDALALLKAQGPRVMTLGEIMKCGDAEIMYLETGVYEKDIKPAIFQPENTQEGYFCFVSGWKFSGFYHVDNYKINWRCWTSRPTEEQRRAAPWES